MSVHQKYRSSNLILVQLIYVTGATRLHPACLGSSLWLQFNEFHLEKILRERQ